jgi:putative endonuclease
MWYTYILRSLADSRQRYIGLTDDLDERMRTHTSGGSPHTSRHRPWEVETLIGFKSKDKAVAFERHLKSGSSFAFAKKHF